MTTDAPTGRHPGESFADYRARLVEGDPTLPPAPRWWIGDARPIPVAPLRDGVHCITTLTPTPTGAVPPA